MESLESTVAQFADTVWSWAAVPIVLALGLYFTIRSGFVQVRLLPRMLGTLTDRTPTDAEGRPQSLSAFQAFTVSAASRVGIGNIAGVGTAIAMGGPGAVFWMWIMAFVGGASSFVESTLAQLYKRRDTDGFRGGPAYYMERGLKARWLGVFFSVLLIVSTPIAVNALQSNTISVTIQGTVGDGAPTWLPYAIAGAIAVLTAAVVFGGIHRIANVTQALVPAMALLYLAVGAVILVINWDQLLPVFGDIFDDAFSGRSVAGGAIGTVIMMGVRRGIFSNEAGLGTAPNAAASAATTHPVKQGLVQTLGVYFDTWLVCSITAFIILVSRPDLSGTPDGMTLTHDAIVGSLGSWSGVLITVIVFLLAFSTILGCYFYGEANLEFITTKKGWLAIYRAFAIAAVFVGALSSAALVWNLMDAILALLAVTNLVAIALLSRHAFALLRNYSEQAKRGLDPVFTRDQLPQIENVDAWEDYESVTGLSADTDQRGTNTASADARETVASS
ncbi:alanine/glycine:cation symporter family protein [Demequina pelophila]|uniref:alanine/glycine:cation symporter family protein n=1 Tax=Demequina pelophila TaxID=1638984 RepID=UPI000785AEA3|nr:alanine/glycine:cation symporter family protein [Demequina pelophila]